MRRTAVGASLIASIGAVLLTVSMDAAPPGVCGALTALKLPNVTVTAADEQSGTLTVPVNGRSDRTLTITSSGFCRVKMTLTPSSDSNIHAEVWLPPADRWNQKFLGVGNGGLSGNIWYTSMARPLNSGYAVANSDLGHTEPDADWALGHPEKLADYAHRGDHVTALAAKRIVTEYYGSGPARSYFHGCSNGGHQALMEAQRYPEDYDAIVAGAPWNEWTRQNVAFAWRAKYLETFNRDKLPMINAAVVKACGGRDGGHASDGYLNDPRTCRFDPKVLQCKGASAADCLTADEVVAVDAIYRGVRTPAGARLYPGYERGSETGWSGSIGSFSTNLWRSMVNKPGDWDVHKFDFAADPQVIEKTLAPLIDSNRVDLSAFRRRGGKILMWHGWTDTTLEPRNAINYYGKVIANQAERTGKDPKSPAALADVQEFFRLFMAPGVNHCGGGLGPNSSFAYTMTATPGPDDPDHDILAALDRWVVNGIAPDTLIASHSTEGKVDRTRPICVYPKLAKYSGQGDPNDPRSFTCVDDRAGFVRDMSELIR